MSREADSTDVIGIDSSQEAASGYHLVLLTVTLGTMLAPLNSTMIAVALPGVMDEFGVGIASAGWLITGYLIGMASLQPLAGKFGDRLGRRNLLLGGLVLFGIVSIGAATAPNLSILLTFRVLQAVTGALIIPNGSAFLREVVPEDKRGSSFGMLGAGIAVAAALGPPLGGALVELAGWRAIFYMNIFLILPAFAIGWKWLPRDKATFSRQQFDVVGAITLPVILISTAAILISVSKGTSLIIPAIGIPLIIVSAIMFGWWELRHADPVVQPRFFRRRAFAAANGGIGLSNLAMYSLLVSVPLMLTARNSSSPLQVGLVLMAMTAGMTVASFLGGRLIDRLGRRLPTIVGLVILAIGTTPLALVGADITTTSLIAGLGLVGVGIGLATPGLQTTSVESVGRGEAGVAAGVYSTSRYLGSILGSAIIAGLLGADRLNVDGLGVVFVVALAAAVLAAIVSLGLRARPTAG